MNRKEKTFNFFKSYIFLFPIFVFLVDLIFYLRENTTTDLNDLFNESFFIKFVCAFIFSFLLKDSLPRKKLSLWLFDFDEKKGLYELPLFWVSIAIFIIPALVLSVPFWCFCFPRSIYYEQILKQLSLPIFVASLSVPVSVLVARFHSSKQVAKKIEVDEANESFKLYFEHKKIFIQHVEETIKEYQDDPIFSVVNKRIKNIDYNTLYNVVFPDSTHRKLNTIPNLDNVYNLLDSIINSILTEADLMLDSAKKISSDEFEFNLNTTKIINLHLHRYMLVMMGINFEKDYINSSTVNETLEFSTSYVVNFIFKIVSFELSRDEFKKSNLYRMRLHSLLARLIKDWVKIYEIYLVNKAWESKK